MSAYFDTLQDIKVLKAQLQFAKKLIKAIKVDVEKGKWIKFKRMPKIDRSHLEVDIEQTKKELNKILDEALK